MKSIFLFVLFSFVSAYSFSQSIILIDGKLHIDSLYKNANENLISQFVLQFPNVKKEELLKKTKNWGAKRFVNLKEVLVGETEDQLVFNYIDNKMFVRSLGLTNNYSWYIRLVAQFKDEKIRIQYFDDGNTYQPGSQYSPAIKARIYKLSNYFKDIDGSLIASKMYTPGMVALK